MGGSVGNQGYSGADYGHWCRSWCNCALLEWLVFLAFSKHQTIHTDPSQHRQSWDKRDCKCPLYRGRNSHFLLSDRQMQTSAQAPRTSLRRLGDNSLWQWRTEKAANQYSDGTRWRDTERHNSRVHSQRPPSQFPLGLDLRGSRETCEQSDSSQEDGYNFWIDKTGSLSAPIIECTDYVHDQCSYPSEAADQLAKVPSRHAAPSGWMTCTSLRSGRRVATVTSPDVRRSMAMAISADTLSAPLSRALTCARDLKPSRIAKSAWVKPDFLRHSAILLMTGTSDYPTIESRRFRRIIGTDNIIKRNQTAIHAA